MAVSEVQTLLPLDTWAEILGVSLWEFNGFLYPAPKSAQCKSVFRKFQWQQDHLSTTEIADAIAAAERMLADELLFWPAPQYIVNEVVLYPRPHQRQAFGFAGTPRGEWKTVQLRWHRVIAGGVFSRTLIGNISGASITLQDNDGDGVFETFTATITDPAIGTITDPTELALYFVAGDRHGEAISESWRIRPVKVSISGNTATIRGHRALLVNPAKAYAVAPPDLDPTVADNYVTTVDCYRVFTDTTAVDGTPNQGVAIWKNDPNCTQDCTFSLIPLCLGQDFNEAGRVFASFGSPSTWPFSYREPDRLQINYLAGLPLVNGQMQREVAQAVTYLSVSLLANEKCGCDRTNRILERWKARITRFEDSANKAAAFAPSDNPFPMTVGGQFAWKRVHDWRDMEVVSI